MPEGAPQLAVASAIIIVAQLLSWFAFRRFHRHHDLV